MAAASFVRLNTTVPASLYFGLDDSAAQVTLYTAGVMYYDLFVPSSAAITAMGWDNAPGYRLIVQLPGTGFGTLGGASGGAVGDHMFQQMADTTKLGFGAVNDGSAAVPDQNWPTLVVFPQFVETWTGDASLSASTRRNRASFPILEAVVAHVLANYTVDRDRMYLFGFSGGATYATQYAEARFRWPDHFKYDFAAIVSMAGGFSGSSNRSILPECEQGESSTNQTNPRSAMTMTAMEVPIWYFNSDADDGAPPAVYGPTLAEIAKTTPLDYGVAIPAGTSPGTLQKGGQWLRYTQYTGGNGVAPEHQGVWDLALSNNTVSGPLSRTAPFFTWLWECSRQPRVEYSTPVALIYAKAAGNPAGGGGGLTSPWSRLQVGIGIGL